MAVRRHHIDAVIGIPYVDVNLLVLLEPRVHRVPGDPDMARHRRFGACPVEGDVFGGEGVVRHSPAFEDEDGAVGVDHRLVVLDSADPAGEGLHVGDLTRHVEIEMAAGGLPERPGPHRQTHTCPNPECGGSLPQIEQDNRAAAAGRLTASAAGRADVPSAPNRGIRS